MSHSLSVDGSGKRSGNAAIGGSADTGAAAVAAGGAFVAVSAPHDVPLELPRGLVLPETTAAALHRAGGILERTVYLLERDCEVAAVLGYHRPRTAQEKLTGFGGVEHLRLELVDRAAEAARQAGAARVVKQLGAAPEVPLDVAYYRQTTEFTCGPVALMMGLAELGLAAAPSLAEELQIWREATTILATDPHGLALAAVRRGARAEVVTSAASVLVLSNPLAVTDRNAALFLERSYRSEAVAAGIPSQVRQFEVAEVAQRVSAGQVLILLIDELEMHGEACPHWVAVTAFEDGVARLEDPWTDAHFGETWVDAHRLAVRPADLAALMWTGNPPVQAFVALSR